MLRNPVDIWDRKIAVQFDEDLFTDLRVSFDVTKTLKGEPNKASITVYNIAPAYYQSLLDRGQELVVRLFAGHGVPVPIFTGNPVKESGVEYVKDGPDSVLKLECKDGFRRYKSARLNLSFDAATPASEVIGRAVAELGLTIDVIDVPVNFEYSRGVVLNGPASKILDRLALSMGADWSIQDDKVLFLPKNKVRRTSGPLYADSLLNIVQAPTKTKDGIKLTTFLDPSIAPGDRFRVDVEQAVVYNGVYKAIAIKHTGDNYGQAFYTDVEGRVIPPETPAPAPDQQLIQDIKRWEDERKKNEAFLKEFHPAGFPDGRDA